MKTLISFCLFVCLVAGNAQSDVGIISGGKGGGAEIKTIALPDTIAVAVGTEMNIWWDQVGLQFPGQDYWGFVAVCDSGNTHTDSYRHTPIESSDVNLTVKAYDPAMVLQKTETCVIASCDTTRGGGDLKQVLFVGASHFAGGEVVTEVLSRFNTDGGTNIELIGTEGTAPNLHEGRGGWSYDDYMTDTVDNPFWIGGRVDFQSYMTDNGFTGDIDYCVVQLGINDAVFGGELATDAEVQAEFTDMVTAFCDTMLSANYGFPGCKVIIGMQPPSADDPAAIGHSYYNWGYRVNLQKNFQKILAATLTLDGAAYSGRVDVCNGGYWVDRYYGYPDVTVDRSARNTTQVTELTNYLHPNSTGYLQMADAYYSHLRWQTGKDAGESGANYMVDSWQFEGASWGYANANITVLDGQVGVDGATTHASLETSTSGQQYTMEYGDHVNATTNSCVISMRAKNHNMPTSGASASTYIRLQDYTDTITHFVRVEWTATPTIYSSTLVDASGVNDLENGWFQLWFYVDFTAYNGNEVGVGFSPWYNGSTIGEGIYIDGITLEFDRTTPGPYVEKP